MLPRNNFPKESFDVITACLCFWYFDHERVMPKLAELLKPEGKLLILYMAWLPFEDKIAGKSEELVLKYSPNWSGARETRHPIWIPDVAYESFDPVEHEEYDVMVPFTKESWHGRMRACRGVGGIPLRGGAGALGCGAQEAARRDRTGGVRSVALRGTGIAEKEVKRRQRARKTRRDGTNPVLFLFKKKYLDFQNNLIYSLLVAYSLIFKIFEYHNN